MKSKKYLFAGAFIALFLTMNSNTAFCQFNATTKWVDQSGDLPGMSSGSGYLVAAAGVVVTGGIVYLIVKNKKKKKQNASSFLEHHPGDLQARSFYDNIKSASLQAPVELVVGQSHSANPGNFNTEGGGVSVGLRYRF